MSYNKIVNNLMLTMLAISAMMFTACSDDDDNRNSGVTMLEVYGPSPALRGGKLTFIGKNLDKVTGVIFPDNIEITDITIESSERISVIIPDNAKEGYVKLTTPKGELTSKTLLTYTEPISISKLTPSPIKAGQKLTIEGDYLNLIQRVIFADNVVVNCANFTAWERKKIEVILPRETQTGTIILADTAAIPLELESEIVLQVVLPSVDNALNLTNKKPGEVITVSGKELDLVEAVELSDGTAVEFSVVENAISFTLPVGVTDGTIVMVAYSGVKVAIANIGVAAPSELSATPDKDIKAGDEIIIKGVNMDLVTSVTFPGVTDAVIPTSKSATEIKVTMPDKAISGDLVLNTASGKTASIAIVTLKLEVLAYDPAPVAAGSTVVLKGKHLDLAASVIFGGDKEGTITASSADALSVTVPVDAETGKVTLKMTNGETVEGTSLTVTKPVFAYIPVLPDADQEIKAGDILQVEIQNGDKLTDVQVNNATVQYILSGSTLNVLIPNNASGKTSLKLISSNGEVSYNINVIGSGGPVETVAWSGLIELTWSAGGRVYVPYSVFENLKAGSIMKIYFQQTDAWGQCQINDGSWGGIKFDELGGTATLSTSTVTDKSVTTQELVLTQAILDQIADKKGEDGANNPGVINGIIMQGSDWIISKVSIITKGGGAASETTIYDDPIELVGWGNNFSIPKTAFENVKAGSTMTVYYTVMAANPQIKLNDDDWKVIEFPDDPNFSTQWGTFSLPEDANKYEIPLTANVLTRILTYVASWNNPAGLIIAGQNVTINKITIK